jgi:diguanylate cyclase (GGDEF)-like protein
MEAGEADSGALQEDGTPLPRQDTPSRVALRTGRPCLEQVVGFPRPDGTVLWISVNAVPLKAPDGHLTGVVSSLVDITPLKLLQERLQAEATRDVLTGLANRRCYLENLTKAFHSARRHGHPLAAAFCDLDHLKALNDAHGHAAGDLAIQAFGGIVAGALRREDLAARFGGDEFCVLFTHVSATEAKVCLERVLAQVRQLELALPDGSRQRGFTASMGLASLQEAHSHPEDILAAADQALYRAKQAGRDRLVTV